MATSRARAAEASGTVTDLTAVRLQRQVVGQATGMLMQRYGIKATTAASLLGRLAAEAGLTVREYAQQLTEDVALDAL